MNHQEIKCTVINMARTLTNQYAQIYQDSKLRLDLLSAPKLNVLYHPLLHKSVKSMQRCMSLGIKELFDMPKKSL